MRAAHPVQRVAERKTFSNNQHQTTEEKIRKRKTSEKKENSSTCMRKKEKNAGPEGPEAGDSPEKFGGGGAFEEKSILW